MFCSVSQSSSAIQRLFTPDFSFTPGFSPIALAGLEKQIPGRIPGPHSYPSSFIPVSSSIIERAIAYSISFMYLSM
jgi:hypothetical protein